MGQGGIARSAENGGLCLMKPAGVNHPAIFPPVTGWPACCIFLLSDKLSRWKFSCLQKHSIEQLQFCFYKFFSGISRTISAYSHRGDGS
jgi:hypothetical protein